MLYPYDQPDVYVKCRTCGIEYPRTEQNFKIYSANGKRNFRKRCRTCHDAQVAKWQESHPENLRNNVRRYQTKKPEIRGIYSRNRRARKLKAESSSYTETEVLTTYGAVCHICKTDIDLTLPRQVGVEGWEMGLHLDHLQPLSMGGSDTLKNIRPAHGKCNLSRPKDGSDLPPNL